MVFGNFSIYSEKLFRRKNKNTTGIPWSKVHIYKKNFQAQPEIELLCPLIISTFSLGHKGCVYYEKCAYHECAYYEWGQYYEI